MQSQKRQNDLCLSPRQTIQYHSYPSHEDLAMKMARVNIDNLGISELTWTGMGEFSSDDHYIHYCGKESLRR